MGIRGAYLDFLTKRLARVAPLNVAVLLLIAVGGAASAALLGQNLFLDDRRLWFNLPANMLMLQGLGVGRNLNGPSWSISAELAAYAAFPLLVALAFHRAAMVRTAFVATCAALLVGVFYDAAEVGREMSRVIPGVMRCFAGFGFGMVAFAVYRSGRWQAIGSDEAVILLLGGIGFTVLMRVDLPAVLMFPFLVLACARNQGVATRVIGSSVPYFLGVISYSIYLMHNMFRWPLLSMLRAAHPATLDTLPALGFALAGTLVVIPFSWAAYCLVERPGRNWVRALARPKARVA